ncbi:MAG TPA: trypsin-like peptidase domain-containing protein [Thermoleophilaceae bacterium]|nr:trypsin-like peptidase domain-containing protein [Thermoleophilaceae bacterium]
MKGPRHLWTGDWRSASHENDEALAEHDRLRPPQEDPLAQPAAATTPPADAADEERRSRLRSTPFAIGLVLAIIAAAALFASSLIGGGDNSSNSNTSAQSANALPAVGSKPLHPRKGQTVAGAIYEAASPAVVSIRAGSGSGTGFLVNSDGTIVTNDHVVDTSKRVIVRFGKDGQTIDADVLGTDPSSDLAVVTIPKSDIPKDVKPLQFADSRNVRVGDTVIAIGNPFDLDRTATQGIVSALGRDIEAPNHYTINNVIQTDAPINPGNSGGPLLDNSAHVIGVNSQIATAGAGGGNLGIGFAVPANTVRQVVPILKKGGTIRRAYLGVQTTPPDPGRGGTGAQIASVVPSGPASRGGLAIGDVIKSIGGKRVVDSTQLSIIVSQKTPGDQVSVVVDRNGTTRTIRVTLGTRPAGTASP